MKSKEILLFGATGQIGRNLIRKLSNNNYKITAVTRNIHRPGYILKTQATPRGACGNQTGRENITKFF